MFDSYTWLAGSANELDKPFTVVLTESRAKFYFGSSDVHSLIGKSIIYRDSVSITVAGIIKDLTFNSDINFTDFVSVASIRNSQWLQYEFRLDSWHYENGNSQVFIKFHEQTNFDAIKAQLPILDELYKQHSSTSTPYFSDNKHALQPLADLHYNAELGIFGHSRSPANLPTLKILMGIAVLLLLIGAVNFINLETAQAFRRAKEVGVRKVLGSSQAKLIIQFLSESLIITAMAILISLPLCEFALGFFKEFVPAGVNLEITKLIPALLMLLITVSLLAGLYPAFVLSSFLPARVLKSQLTVNGTRTAFLRKSLIVFQFTFAQALIIVTLIIGWQINFMLTKDLGFRKEAIVYFFTPGNFSDAKILKTELEKIAEVDNVSSSGRPPSYPSVSYTYITYLPGNESDNLEISMSTADESFLNVYDIELLAGKNLSPVDTAREVLINETLLRKLGFKNAVEAVGHSIQNHNRTLIITGVVKDFHIESLRNTVEPLLLMHATNLSCLNIKLTWLEGEQLKTALTKIETAWKRVYPEEPFQLSFMDETLNNFYQNEKRTSKLVTTATFMAIFISCLGLWGLASYAAVQRTKEIGIRKILGATVHSIVALLSKNFVILVLLAFILAAPLAWRAGNLWLNGFAYRIEINAWIFIITVIGAVFIMFVTIGYQTYKAASTNPVNSLRSE